MHAVCIELEKENKEFFEAYSKNRASGTETEARQRIQNMPASNNSHSSQE